ncbi:MAG: glutamine synthetase type III, partial [Lachnospiraceae bacterium]|nr:glutamine synthetase type III [Lachnospiraceae bacterium]
NALLDEVQKAVETLEKDVAKAAKLEGKKQAVYYRDTICVDMVALRTPADALERIVDKELWPFPTYGDLIFEV